MYFRLFHDSVDVLRINQDNQSHSVCTPFLTLNKLEKTFLKTLNTLPKPKKQSFYLKIDF